MSRVAHGRSAPPCPPERPLTALAIIDDLGAVVIIALFYTAGLSLPDLAGAAAVIAALVGLNRFGVRRLSSYLLLGLVLWVLVLRSGIHATLAGVVLAFTIPLRPVPGRSPDGSGPLHRLEHALILPVGFLIVPISGLANAGVPFLGLPAEALAARVAACVVLRKSVFLNIGYTIMRITGQGGFHTI